MAAARYPGDPRARPDRSYCAVTATGSIRRRREDLINKAVVCWLYSNSHDTEAHHLGDAIRGRLHLRHEDIQIVKHYPEQFLIIFFEPANREQLLDRGVISEGGQDFHFAPWSERRNAVNTNWEFRVKVRIEGIPVHCWAEDVAARTLGRSCAVHFLEEKTCRRERTRTFDLWAWCCNPYDIPKEVLLTVTEPDRELPPTSIPLLQAPPRHDKPVDLKRAHVYTLRNHLEWVEDLTILQGRGRAGGPMNRKPRRELVWSYGVPDSVGERPPGRRGDDRGRGFGHHQRRDDYDYDYDHGSRNYGIRRHRSVSSWARNSRCRGAMDDCISSNRWRGGRGSPPTRGRGSTTLCQAPTMVWKVKATKDRSKQKKVSFADPIATELKAPRPTLRDDSIMLIKEKEASKEPEQGGTANVTNNTVNPLTIEQLAICSSVDKVRKRSARSLSRGGTATVINNTVNLLTMAGMGEDVQQAIIETLKLMERELILPCNNLHFQRPIEQNKMEAIQILIEQGNKKRKASTTSKRMAAQVVLEA
ncbi:unnamed protein product [Miscanthus lutarioriparius]|uniref:DUF4283 domain-containing protein n=1 Tax=Miscanthus lutarioriparius TaxID=422564 RepID=A0A811MWL3_9POAL|nr:unnamed protein product [Miscanthus lutarioriparius]